MSSRALRKLHGDSDIHVPGLEGSSDEDANPQPVTSTSSRRNRRKQKQTAVNPFDLLNEDADDTIELVDENKEDINETENILEENNIQNTDNQTNNVLQVTKKKKKKKKKKGKDKALDTANDHITGMQDEDEIDACIREVNQILGELPGSLSSSHSADAIVTVDMKALLQVEHKHLNPDNEMKRIFGSRVVQAEASRRRGRNRVYQRSTWLSQPKDSWPPVSRLGLTMQHQDTKDGCQYFTFDHSNNYQQIQFQFLDAVESFNPENIVQLLHLYPYHIDSLIQLSEVCKMGEDMQMATELIERALYSFETSFHPNFSLTKGTCRLDYKRPENRAFYLALFRHLLFVGQKGCYRTALEFCKLILSLDPDSDPLCMSLMIDFYALKSEQYSFLARMFAEWEAYKNLSQLPNMAFSVPLAMFHLAHQDNSDTAEADRQLQNALLMFPGVLLLLLDRCNIASDNQVSSNTFFTNAQIDIPAALNQLMSLYVGRCFPCWKEPGVVTWLMENVLRVIDLVNQNDPRLKEFEEKRKNRYNGAPRNLYRHIMLSEIKDATAALPPEMAHTPVMSYDPLPPTNTIVSYTRPQRPRRVDQEGNMMSSFLRSLLPNYNPQELADEAAGAAGGEEPANFRQSVGALMAAMRDLLSNIQPVPAPVEGQQNQEQEDEQDAQEWD